MQKTKVKVDFPDWLRLRADFICATCGKPDSVLEMKDEQGWRLLRYKDGSSIKNCGQCEIERYMKAWERREAQKAAERALRNKIREKKENERKKSKTVKKNLPYAD